MHSTIELLEHRTHFSVSAAVYRADLTDIHADERVSTADLGAIAKVESPAKKILTADFKRLHLSAAGRKALAALSSEQAIDLKSLKKDSAAVTIVSNRDVPKVLSTQKSFEQRPSSQILSSNYSLALSLSQTQGSAAQQAFYNALYMVSIGNEITQLDAIGAIAPLDTTLAGHVSSALSGLSTAITTVDGGLTSLIGGVSIAIGDITGVKFFGTENLDGFNFPTGANPLAGAVFQGLTIDLTSAATNEYRHGYPFGLAFGDFAGTDQIYVGENQSAQLDGYAGDAGRVAGPQILTLNYSSLVKAGQPITSLTLGIGADDFQNPTLMQPYTASVNGVVNPALTALLNSQNDTGPTERYISIGIDPAMLNSSNVLTVTINEGGNGGDGWSTDFLTIGINNG